MKNKATEPNQALQRLTFGKNIMILKNITGNRVTVSFAGDQSVETHGLLCYGIRYNLESSSDVIRCLTIEYPDYISTGDVDWMRDVWSIVVVTGLTDFEIDEAAAIISKLHSRLSELITTKEKWWFTVGEVYRYSPGLMEKMLESVYIECGNLCPPEQEKLEL